MQYNKFELNKLIKLFVSSVIRKYNEIEDLSEDDFKLAADKSLWPDSMYKMRSGKDMIAILQETNTIEMLYLLKKYDQQSKEEVNKNE